jgi:hypothetical protein
MPHLRKSCRSSRGSTKSSGPNTALEATGHSVRFVAGVGLYPVARASAWACVPCMLSCSGVKVSCPGVHGAEGQGKRQGATARWGLKEAWNARAGRGTRTGYEGWDRRDERARDRQVFHPQTDCAVEIRRLCTDGMTADHGRHPRCLDDAVPRTAAQAAGQQSQEGGGPPLATDVPGVELHQAASPTAPGE